MLKLDIQGDRSALKRAQRALKKLPDLVSDISDQQYQYTMSDFGVVTPDGAGHPDSPTFNNLVLSGSLRDSITLQKGGGSATISTDHPLARIHQGGDGPVPARPFMGIGDRYITRHEKTAEQWLKSYFG